MNVARTIGLAVALLLAVQVQAGPASALEASCQKVQAGVLMMHARYDATFRVVQVDAKHGRAYGTFPGTPHGTVRVPVRCADLLKLEDLK
jgi:hypothetical protein